MRVALAAFGALALVLAACGSGASSFPEEIVCVEPAPLPTSRAAPGTVSAQSYVSRVRSSADTLVKLRGDLRAKYADDTFFRRSEFRPDFATYADQTICTAQAMQALSAPDTRFAEFDSKLEVTLIALVEHTEFGREAVRARNVSDYRDWFKEADAKIAAVREAAYSQR